MVGVRRQSASILATSAYINRSSNIEFTGYDYSVVYVISYTLTFGELMHIVIY